jgi:hypothetical protein
MFGEGLQLSYPVSVHLDRNKAVQDFVEIDASESVSVIDPTEIFCTVSDGECKVRDKMVSFTSIATILAFTLLL